MSMLASPRRDGEGLSFATFGEADLGSGLTPPEVTAAAREQRRMEMERELCEKLGLQMEVGAKPQVCKAVPRPTSAGPSRPPKPKPHRPLPKAPESFQTPISAEDLPRVRRWKSSALSPLPTPNLESNERPELSKTAPATLGDDLVEGPSSPEAKALPQGTGLCIAINIKQQPSAPLSLEASPASGADMAEEAPATSAAMSPASADASAPSCEAHEEGVFDSEPMVTKSELTGSKLLEESSRRLRENLQRLRLENRRHRVRPVVSADFAEFDTAKGCPPVWHAERKESPTLGAADVEKLRKFEELRRKIASLEEASWAEEQRLRMEQKETEERREKQEAFERSLQEQTERQLQEHREREAREAAEQVAREEEARQQLEERQSRRKMQLEQEEQRSRQLEEQRLGRSNDGPGLDASLERQWAEQEAEERRRVEDYARFRRNKFEEWEKQFAAERLRFASEAEFCAAKLRQRARVAAAADEQFYASQREIPWHEEKRPTAGVEGDSHLAPEERQVLKELRSVLGAPKETQKAKVKDLLIRWHPDKNPGCPEKAKQLFQFLQEQRHAVLGF